jgi:hypothetical protein
MRVKNGIGRTDTYLYERVLAGCRHGLLPEMGAPQAVSSDPVELASRKRARQEPTRIQNILPWLEGSAFYWREQAEPGAAPVGDD